MIKADIDVDSRYEFLRRRHGGANPAANGYRVAGFFAREQRVIFSALDQTNGPFLDIACGSGLMLEPLLKRGHTVLGIDYNTDACRAARDNGITIARGDAFALPLADNSISQIVNCQFLNQQDSARTRQFIFESARVLKPGGQLIILWRHARSLMHHAAHAVFRFKDHFTGQPDFPQFIHPMEEIEGFARAAGLRTVRNGVTLPFLKPDILDVKSPLAPILGASLFLVLTKP